VNRAIKRRENRDKDESSTALWNRCFKGCYETLKERESYLVSRISKEGFKTHNTIYYTRYEIRTTRYVSMLDTLQRSLPNVG